MNSPQQKPYDFNLLSFVSVVAYLSDLLPIPFFIYFLPFWNALVIVSDYHIYFPSYLKNTYALLTRGPAQDLHSSKYTLFASFRTHKLDLVDHYVAVTLYIPTYIFILLYSILYKKTDVSLVCYSLKTICIRIFMKHIRDWCIMISLTTKLVEFRKRYLLK